MGDVKVIPLVDEGLGNSAYLLDLDDGRALAVDVSRKLRPVRELAERRGLGVYRALPDRRLGRPYWPGLPGAHRGAGPGPVPVLQGLAKLDGDVTVWPPHGAGSFCSAPLGAERTSTISTERATNTLLRAESEDAFVQQLLDSLGTFPPYFLPLGEVNRRGPALVTEDHAVTGLTAAEVARLKASGATAVDVRRGRLRSRPCARSVSIPLRSVFATWLGWLVESGKPIVVVRNADQTRPKSCARPARSATTRSSGSLTVASTPGMHPVNRQRRFTW